MHGNRSRNSLVEFGTLEKFYGFSQDSISKILKSGVIRVRNFSDFEKLFGNYFTSLVDIFTPDW